MEPHLGTQQILFACKQALSHGGGCRKGVGEGGERVSFPFLPHPFPHIPLRMKKPVCGLLLYFIGKDKI